RRRTCFGRAFLTICRKARRPNQLRQASSMNQDTTDELQTLLDRLREWGKTARRKFLELACARLRRLAAKILYGSFGGLQARHEVDSVVHETWLRLMQALDQAD